MAGLTLNVRSILCLLRVPPAAGGHGGSQRAWRLVAALCRMGRVHVVIVHRPSDRDMGLVSLAPLRALAATLTIVPVPAWESIGHRHRRLPWRLAIWLDMLRIGSGEAPRLPRRAIRTIAAALPSRSFDIVVAGRLPCAVIADRLMAVSGMNAPLKMVDLDDRLSAFKSDERRAAAIGPVASLLQRLDIAAVARAERSLRSWDAISLCHDGDGTRMAAMLPGTPIVTLPNVVDRPLLPPPLDLGLKLLFVGNLGFAPNRHGLARFLDEAWPVVRAASADATLTVVGMTAPAALRARLAREAVALYENVDSVEPFYRAATVVICPIFFGGGTRIKLLEAMAYGRAIVSTTVGAAGLDIEPDRHASIADTMPAFADALLRLGADPALRDALVARARALQQRRFAPAAFDAAMTGMVAAAQARAATA